MKVNHVEIQISNDLYHEITLDVEADGADGQEMYNFKQLVMDRLYKTMSYRMWVKGTIAIDFMNAQLMSLSRNICHEVDGIECDF